MSHKPLTLPGRLAAAIARMAAKREQWKQYVKDRSEIDVRTPASFAPAIFLMTQAIDKAIFAADTGVLDDA